MTELLPLIESIKDAQVDPEAPPVMNETLRAWLADFDPEESDVPELVSEWVARREELLRAGADVIERLEEKHPTPNFHDVVAGDASFPAWHGSKAWEIVAFHPWAEEYEWALNELKPYLDAE